MKEKIKEALQELAAVLNTELAEEVLAALQTDPEQTEQELNTILETVEQELKEENPHIFKAIKILASIL